MKKLVQILLIILIAQSVNGQWFKYLSSNDKKWKYGRELSWENGLRATSHQYKMLNISTTDEIQYKGQTIPKKTEVEWGFKVTFFNSSSKTISFNGEYILFDKDDFEVESSPIKGYWGNYKSEFITLTPGEEITIKNTSVFDYNDLKRIHHSSMTIFTKR